jgi:4-alpha-glucanotransferase
MDAKIDGWVVTPRVGKPVEVNALWYNALRIVADALSGVDEARAAELTARADRVRDSFLMRFARPDRALLADVVDGPAGDDWSVRPNQLFAVSLPYPLIEGDAARWLVEGVGQALLTSYGLRSLAAEDAAYKGVYTGDRLARDGAYHQGTVWAWLLGPYAEAVAAVTGDPSAGLLLLRSIADHLHDAGLGSVSEIFDGDTPHTPRGAIAQAWSVAEILRVWRKLTALPPLG